ncbi:MAG TPA: addiction module protein [Pyrinomonadaceae bacterium]|nr:addiction module protein [Pyrinomonadaceae bacterium]
METFPNDFDRDEEAVPIYEWQKEILDQRERLIDEDKTRFIDWEEAKKRIAKETSISIHI